MNKQIERLIEQIGNLLIEAIATEFATAWMYAQIQPGVSTLQIIYCDPDGSARSQRPSAALDATVYKLHTTWSAATSVPWTRMMYTLRGDGRFSMELGYEDIFTDDELAVKLRNGWFEERLGERASQLV